MLHCHVPGEHGSLFAMSGPTRPNFSVRGGEARSWRLTEDWFVEKFDLDPIQDIIVFPAVREQTIFEVSVDSWSARSSGRL